MHIKHACSICQSHLHLHLRTGQTIQQHYFTKSFINAIVGTMGNQDLIAINVKVELPVNESFITNVTSAVPQPDKLSRQNRNNWWKIAIMWGAWGLPRMAYGSSKSTVHYQVFFISPHFLHLVIFYYHPLVLNWQIKQMIGFVRLDTWSLWFHCLKPVDHRHWRYV